MPVVPHSSSPKYICPVVGCASSPKKSVWATNAHWKKVSFAESRTKPLHLPSVPKSTKIQWIYHQDESDVEIEEEDVKMI
uniref:Uncharacterized protein n=1 Tax=Caenorhabditis japonica TaxID=281687 RepID=A0A8R1IG24_CAEJA